MLDQPSNPIDHPEQSASTVETLRQPPSLDGLTNSELAVAIRTGGIPSKWRTLTLPAITRLAEAGLHQLGLDEIRRLDKRSRELMLSIFNRLRHDESADVTSELAARREIWSSPRQEQAAVDLAYAITVNRTRRNTGRPKAA